MPSKDSTTTGILVLTFAIAMGTTAAVTYILTSQKERLKYLEEKKAAYEREVMIKEKTVKARKLAGEKPAAGTLVDDVSIQRVYLWEVEDLKKRFQPSKLLNTMKNVGDTNVNYFFPTLKVTSSMAEDDEDLVAKQHETNYNKLITNHECILANLVRKPNQETFTHAYVRYVAASNPLDWRCLCQERSGSIPILLVPFIHSFIHSCNHSFSLLNQSWSS